MNLYQIIGVSNNAKPSMIEAAYRKATLDLDERYERGEDVIEARKNLLAAFEVLSNPAKREAYDDRLAATQFGKKQAPTTQTSDKNRAEATPAHDKPLTIPARTPICTTCGAVGYIKSSTPGSTLIELVLWLAFIVPGLVYSLWRLNSRKKVCRKCGSTSLIPVGTPLGQKMLNDVAPGVQVK